MKLYNKHHIILLAAVLLFAQGYFSIASIKHALHNMPVNCPVCSHNNHFDDVAINHIQNNPSQATNHQTPALFKKFNVTQISSAYFARAPPA